MSRNLLAAGTILLVVSLACTVQIPREGKNTPVPATQTAPVERIQPATASSTEFPQEAVVIAFQWLYVRGGPGVGYQVVGHLDNGDVVELIGRCDVGGWRRVRLVDLEGWVNSRYLDGGCR
jgi:uncharacterized protein YgiM (DUF1202 family)